MGVEVRQGYRTARGVDPRVFAVAVTAPSGLALARFDLETTSDLQAIALARLFATAPRMASTLYDLDVWLENTGHDPQHPWRRAIREALDFATTVPLSCL